MLKHGVKVNVYNEMPGKTIEAKFELRSLNCLIYGA